MIKSIKKTCIMDDETIQILLEDTRDSYITKNYLGVLGSIFISKEGTTIISQPDYDLKIQALKEKYLLKAFKEIFNEENYEPLTDKYYEKIQNMIKDGTIESLGYEIKKIESNIEELYEYEEPKNYKIFK